MNLLRMLCCALGSAAFAGTFAIAGCSGDVNSTGGEGGSGSASSSAASTGTMNPTAGGPETCADICHKLETNNCGAPPQGDCTAFCQDQFEKAGECADELGALYACWLPFAVDCPDEPPPECQSEESAFEACDAIHGCGDTQCSAGQGPNGVEECGCKQTCAMKDLETSCKADPMAMKSTCDCLVDGTSIGTCEGGAELSCGIEGSCCEALFKE
jgi:hypothetical protein